MDERASSSMPCAAEWERRPTRRSAPASRRVSPPASFELSPGRSTVRAASSPRQRRSGRKTRSFENGAGRPGPRSATHVRSSRPFRSPKRARSSIKRSVTPSNRYLRPATRIQGLQGVAGGREDDDAGRASGKARNRAAMRSRASPRPPAPPASSATRALPPTPCRASLPAAGIPTRQRNISIWSMNRRWHRRNRCGSFFDKIGPQDKVLLIGDIRQHQGVDAGKPFEQLQQAGMQTAQLDQIVRQRDPELLKAVEHLSKNETEIGVQMLQQQGRVTEIVDPQERIDCDSEELTPPILKTPSSSLPTTLRVERSIRPCVRSCRRLARSTRKTIPCACSRRAPT